MMHYYLLPFAGALGTFSLFTLAVGFVIFVLPFVLILKKAGYSALWILVAFIPMVNFIFLWIFALVRWPVEERADRVRT